MELFRITLCFHILVDEHHSLISQHFAICPNLSIVIIRSNQLIVLQKFRRIRSQLTGYCAE